MYKKIISILKREIQNRYKKYQESKLGSGEIGFGIPEALPPTLNNVGKNKSVKVAIIGLGAQGIAQINGYLSVPGFEIVGIIELNQERLTSVKSKYRFNDSICYLNLSSFLESKKDVDLVSIATTASFHLDIASQLIKKNIPKIIIEKPLDASLNKCYEFISEVKNSRSKVAVNYCRRWLPDHKGIKKIIDSGAIGEIKTVSVVLGEGELARNGSHFFDFVNFIVDDIPKSVIANLKDKDSNSRGNQYNDPSGFCLFHYQNGVKFFIDFSENSGPKSTQFLVKGTMGYIFVDEVNMYWNLYQSGQSVWNINFNEAMKSYQMFARVAANFINSSEEICSISDALISIEMIYAANFSSKNNSEVVLLSDSSLFSNLELNYP
jgi:predicted dehydrogenase